MIAFRAGFAVLSDVFAILFQLMPARQSGYLLLCPPPSICFRPLSSPPSPSTTRHVYCPFYWFLDLMSFSSGRRGLQCTFLKNKYWITFSMLHKFVLLCSYRPRRSWKSNIAITKHSSSNGRRRIGVILFKSYTVAHLQSSSKTLEFVIKSRGQLRHLTKAPLRNMGICVLAISSHHQKQRFQ